MPDQGGRVAVVTGANSGLGLITARELARKGATVVMGCRDPGRGERAHAEVAAAAPAAEVALERLDLADLGSVREFAARVGEAHPRIDLLVNNAGIMAPPRSETADGFELQLGTNHLGHFALTGLLLERLLAGSEPRVVTVSSGAHWMGRIRFDDLQHSRRYERWTAYAQSKLANLLFACELDRRARRRRQGAEERRGSPGLQRDAPPDRPRGGGLVSRLNTAVMAVTQPGARAERRDGRPAVRCTRRRCRTCPAARSWARDSMGGFRGHPTLASSSQRARATRQRRKRLWDVSAELTGVDYAALARMASAGQAKAPSVLLGGLARSSWGDRRGKCV